MPKSIPARLATSLAPKGNRDIQRHAVTSWLQTGFNAISVNTEDEISVLKGDFPEVAFVAAPRTGDAIAGRPVPYIADLITAARNVDSGESPEVLGVINDDIILSGEADLATRLAHQASDAFLLGPRVDIDDLTHMDAGLPAEPAFSVGYDYFLFPATFAEQVGPAPFCIGMPFWDFWLPLRALLQGYNLKTVKIPIARHVTHDTRWDDTIYFFFHALITDLVALTKNAEDAPAIDPALRQMHLLSDILAHTYASIFEAGTNPPPDLSDAAREAAVNTLAAYYDRLQEAVVHHIKHATVSITSLPELP